MTGDCCNSSTVLATPNFAWASAYLAGGVWGAAVAAHGDEETARRALIAVASDPTDITMTQVAVIVHEAMRDIT